MLSEEQLTGIETRCEAATPLYQYASHVDEDGDHYSRVFDLETPGRILLVTYGGNHRANADLAAAARDDVPALLAEVRRLAAVARAVIAEREEERRFLAHRYGVMGITPPERPQRHDPGCSSDLARWIEASYVLDDALAAAGYEVNDA